MCYVLEVSRSSYYAYMRRPESKRYLSNEKLGEKIKEIYLNSRKRYGVLRITAELRNRHNIHCSKNRVHRLMIKQGIKAIYRRKYRTVRKHTGSINNHADNLVCMQFNPGKANIIWTSDITYIWTEEGWLYLAVVMDLYSRKVIGWKADKHMEESLVVDALRKAIDNRKVNSNTLNDSKIILHSDRGSQYRSFKLIELMNKYNINQSMNSRYYSCLDNAPTESFFATLKKELIYRSKYKTRSEAIVSIFEYIEIFYNRKRRHSSLGYLSPLEFEHLNNLNINPPY
jgi:putative transposase